MKISAISVRVRIHCTSPVLARLRGLQELFCNQRQNSFHLCELMERVATSFLLTIVCTVVSIGDSWRCESGMDREDRDALIARYLPEGWHLEDELALLAVQSGEKQSVMEKRLQVLDNYINYRWSGADAVTADAADVRK